MRNLSDDYFKNWLVDIEFFKTNDACYYGLNWYEEQDKLKPIKNMYELIHRLIENKKFNYLDWLNYSIILKTTSKISDYVTCCNCLCFIKRKRKNIKIAKNIKYVLAESVDTYCETFDSLVIPKSVEYISNDFLVFYRSTKLETLVLYNEFEDIDSVPCLYDVTNIFSDSEIIERWCDLYDIQHYCLEEWENKVRGSRI